MEPSPRLTRPQLLTEIARLYARLRALPPIDQPCSGRTYHGSPRYVAIQQEIRLLAEAYSAADDEKG
jgi:hypothetical protein